MGAACRLSVYAIFIVSLSGASKGENATNIRLVCNITGQENVLLVFNAYDVRVGCEREMFDGFLDAGRVHVILNELHALLVL